MALTLRDSMAPALQLRDQPSIVDQGLAFEQYQADDSNPVLRGWRSAGLGSEANSLFSEANAAERRGDMLAAQAYEQQAQDSLRRSQVWAPTTQEFTKIDGLRSAGSWLGGQIGNLRTSVPPLVGGVAGGLGGAALGGLVAGPGGAALGGRIGAGLGAGAMGYGMEYDESVGNAMMDPQIRATRSADDIHNASMVKGAVAGALESVVPAGVAKAALLGVGKKVAAESLKKGMVKAAAIDAAQEAMTEAAQELTGQSTQNYLRGEDLTNWDAEQAFNAAMGGAVGGAVMGAGGQAAGTARDYLANREPKEKRDLLGRGIDAFIKHSEKKGREEAQREIAGMDDEAVLNKLFGKRTPHIADPISDEESKLSDEEIGKSRRALAEQHALEVVKAPAGMYPAEEVQAANEFLTGQAKDWMKMRDVSRTSRADKKAQDDAAALMKAAGLKEEKNSLMSPTLTDDFGEQEGRSMDDDIVTDDQGNVVRRADTRDMVLPNDERGFGSTLRRVTSLQKSWDKQATEEQAKRTVTLADVLVNGGYWPKDIVDAAKTATQKEAQLTSAATLLTWLKYGMMRERKVKGGDTENVIEHLVGRYGKSGVDMLNKAYEVGVNAGLFDRNDEMFAERRVEAEKLLADEKNHGDLIMANLSPEFKREVRTKEDLASLVREVRRMASAVGAQANPEHSAKLRDATDTASPSRVDQRVLERLFPNAENRHKVLAAAYSPSNSAFGAESKASQPVKETDGTGRTAKSFEVDERSSMEAEEDEDDTAPSTTQKVEYLNRKKGHAYSKKDPEHRAQLAKDRKEAQADGYRVEEIGAVERALEVARRSKGEALSEQEKFAVIEKEVKKHTRKGLDRPTEPPANASDVAKRLYADELKRYKQRVQRAARGVDNRFVYLKRTETTDAPMSTELDLEAILSNERDVKIDDPRNGIGNGTMWFKKKTGGTFIINAPQITRLMFQRTKNDGGLNHTVGTGKEARELTKGGPQNVLELFHEGVASILAHDLFTGEFGYVHGGKAVPIRDTVKQLKPGVGVTAKNEGAKIEQRYAAHYPAEFKLSKSVTYGQGVASQKSFADQIEGNEFDTEEMSQPTHRMQATMWQKFLALKAFARTVNTGSARDALMEDYEVAMKNFDERPSLQKTADGYGETAKLKKAHNDLQAVVTALLNRVFGNPENERYDVRELNPEQVRRLNKFVANVQANIDDNRKKGAKGDDLISRRNHIFLGKWMGALGIEAGTINVAKAEVEESPAKDGLQAYDPKKAIVRGKNGMAETGDNIEMAAASLIGRSKRGTAPVAERKVGEKIVDTPIVERVEDQGGVPTVKTPGRTSSGLTDTQLEAARDSGQRPAAPSELRTGDAQRPASRATGGRGLLDKLKSAKPKNEFHRRAIKKVVAILEGGEGKLVDALNTMMRWDQSLGDLSQRQRDALKSAVEARGEKFEDVPIEVYDDELGYDPEQAEFDRAEFDGEDTKYSLMSTEIHNNLGKSGFAATHDSPIRHEGKFNWREHSGKGEGNAAFGAGTYLSTANSVHHSYKNQFTAEMKGTSFTWGDSLFERGEEDNEIYKDGDTAMTPAENAVAYEILVNGKSPEEALKYARERAYWIAERSAEDAADHISVSEPSVTAKELSYVLSAFRNYKPMEPDKVAPALKPFFSVERWNKIVEAADRKAQALADVDISGISIRADSRSPTYHVTVNIKQDELLDWNAPLSEQSAKVQKALADGAIDITAPDYKRANLTALQAKLNARKSDPSGQLIYSTLVSKLGSQAKASDYLQSLGILGHVYNAAGGKEANFRNYVIYDDSKIETNYVHFSKKAAKGKASTPEEQAAVAEQLHKLLGKDVEILFENLGGKSGSWTREQTMSVIRIAINADITSTGFHESMHQLLYLLKQGKGDGAKVVEQLQRAAMSPIMQQRLRTMLKDHPKAMSQLADPEEAISYMFQFWMMDQSGFKIGPETRTLFERFKDFLRSIAALFSKTIRTQLLTEQASRIEAETTLRVLNDLAAGKMADPTQRPSAIKVMAEYTGKRDEAVKNLGEGYKQLLQGFGKYLATNEGLLESYNNRHLTRLARLFNQRAGEAKREGASFFDERDFRINKMMNKWEKVAQKYSKEDLEIARAWMSTEQGQAHPDAGINAIVTDVKGILDEMKAYIAERDIKRLEPNPVTGKMEWKSIDFRKHYWPRIWDAELVNANKEEILEKLLAYTEVENIAKAATKEALKQGKPEVTKEDVALQIFSRMLGGTSQVELSEELSDLGMTPVATAVNRRSLEWLNMREFDKYVSKDMNNIMSAYIRNIIKRGEYQHRFGPGGEFLKELVDSAILTELGGEKLLDDAMARIEQDQKNWGHAKAEAELAGKKFDREYPTTRSVGLAIYRSKNGDKAAEKIDATMKRLEPAFQAIMALEGTLGSDIDPTLRNVSSWVTTYQNYRLLVPGIFSSFMDVMGVVREGGELSDAWGAFVAGIKEIRNTWTNEKGRDYMMERAELFGSADAGSYASTIGEANGSVYMSEGARKWSDRLFKWNGMEGWNRGMRAYATSVAERILLDWQKNGIDTKDKAAVARVERLFGKGFDVKNIAVEADGTLDIKDARNIAAVNRWVLDAVIRPNAAHRPVMASDPHMQVFYHLKNFTYSMHAVMLKNVAAQARLGNYRPAMVTLVGYAPIAIAAGAVKELLIPGDEPPWLKNGLVGYLGYGWDRAGGLGIPQMYASNLFDPAQNFGPSAGQLQDLITVPFGEFQVGPAGWRDHRVFEEMLGAAPFGTVLKRIGKNVDDIIEGK